MHHVIIVDDFNNRFWEQNSGCHLVIVDGRYT